MEAGWRFREVFLKKRLRKNVINKPYFFPSTSSWSLVFTVENSICFSAR